MKKNYKNVKRTLGMFATILITGVSQANAQVATEYTYNLRTASDSTYVAGAITLISDEITKEGTTFKIQAIVTPSSTAGSSYVESNASNRWGVDGATIDANLGESATINAISVVDFNANGTGYLESSISNLHFDGITVRGGDNQSVDNPSITVDGVNSGTYDIGQTVSTTETITFGVPFVNLAGESFTVGSDNDVTSITMTTADSPSFKNTYQIVGTNVSYTFTTDALLSSENIKKDGLTIFPTVVESTFTVNKEFESLKIIDITGKTVKLFGASDSLEVTGLGSGVYIVVLDSKTEGVVTGRLIIK
ncbi:T9SS type A sorting domain-containing protein [Wenyingzhuangia sp. 2_MG-2023]|nr:T9SS type A sorting domain-containing protein [Wenyingzhuangia sp. 2_MG-2023]MDO6737748.1 T9SS type A sorting domain-containing protein [Wenyingzhuangia sp. 2_MG-2023]